MGSHFLRSLSNPRIVLGKGKEAVKFREGYTHKNIQEDKYKGVRWCKNRFKLGATAECGG